MELGIDIGTSSVTMVAVDDSVILGQAARSLTTRSPHPYWSEQSPLAWWQAVVAAVAELAASLTPERMRAIEGIGLSGQMHALVALDHKKVPVRPAILWNDGRAHLEASDLAHDLAAIPAIAGVPPQPGFSAPKLLWLKRNEPQTHDKIRHLMLAKDYIGLRLHGGLATDASDAAGSLWFDQARRAWADPLIAATGGDPDWLPPALEGNTVAGQLTRAAAKTLGLRPGIPVIAGAGDAAAGAIAAGAVDVGRGFISLGTSAQLFLAEERCPPYPGGLVHAFAHTLADRWYRMAAMLNGARPIAWFANVCQAPIETLLAEAVAFPSQRIPIFLPYLTGERTPHGDPHIRGAFYDLEDHTDRAAMTRAVIEAIAFSFADAVEALGDTGSISTLTALGGGAQSDLLLQTIADTTGFAVARPTRPTLGPAFGAARLAALATGTLSRTDLSAPAAAETTFSPRKRDDLADRLMRYRQLYQALKPMRRRPGLHQNDGP